MLKDESDDYFGLKAKCIDMCPVLDHYDVPNAPVTSFDLNMHTVDEGAKELLDKYTMISASEIIPVNVKGDGDCLFHSLQVFYPIMSIDEIRARCIDELCIHEHYYETLKTEMALDLVDDESVQQHVLRILHNQQYTGVNDNDPYCEILNKVFVPRGEESTSSRCSLRIMWTGPETSADQMWRPNHFTPVLSIDRHDSVTENSIDFENIDEDITSAEIIEVPLETVLHATKSRITYTNEINDDKENTNEMKTQSVFGKRQVFVDAPTIIEYMIDAVKEKKIFEQPPKLLTRSSMFLVKLTEENLSSIAKDGNGIWRQDSSTKTLFVLKEKDKYQIVLHDASGQLFYIKREGNRYISCPVNSNDVFTMQRCYATNGANSSLRRLIAYSRQPLQQNNLSKLDLPIFLQYLASGHENIENLRLKPHGNSRRSDRPFTSTLPSVLTQIKAQPKFLKPSTIYNSLINNVEEAALPSLTTVRDRKQVYNAREKSESSVEEYLSIMKSLETTNSIVSRFSMNRGEAPVLVLSQAHMIKELKRCCITASDQAQPSVLCIDTTFNLGRFYVTPIAFQNTSVQYRKTKKAPIFIGPVMIHYRNDAESYEELLDYVRRSLNNCDIPAVGSDGDKAIKKAVDTVFPNSTHLYCTRHVRENIERELKKRRTTRDERHTLLELIFDSSESLIQSETQEEFEDRLNELSECWTTIQERDDVRFTGGTDFFGWFTQHQTNIFRNHLIAAIRIPINFVDRNGSPRLFYNNDIESMNHTFKNQTNWERKSLSEIIDVLENLITRQKNETIRALYNSGEFELVPPYARFVSDSRIWSAKTTEERKTTIEKYYSFVPPVSKSRRELNIPPNSGRKPGRSNTRGSSTTTRKKK